jgi:hypothetical protein
MLTSVLSAYLVASDLPRALTGISRTNYTNPTSNAASLPIFRQRGPVRSALSYAVKLAATGIGKRPKDNAGALIDDLTKVHGQGENHDQKE